jgi:hypothetical protein
MADPAGIIEGQIDEHSAVFNKVRATIKLHFLPQLASHLRDKGLSQEGLISSTIDCRIIPEPLFGSHHILFQIEFTDGVRWLLKVPANGYQGAFDEMSASSLRSEALTMRLIKRETTVPVPEVYGFDDSCDNQLCCPFILMEHTEGRPLYDVWFNQSIAPEVLEQHRSQALHGVAKAMIQLNKFAFSQGVQSFSTRMATHLATLGRSGQ